MIRSYLIISENFVRLIFQERFWVEHLPFLCMVKCKSLALLPVVQLSHIIIILRRLLVTIIPPYVVSLTLTHVEGKLIFLLVGKPQPIKYIDHPYCSYSCDVTRPCRNIFIPTYPITPGMVDDGLAIRMFATFYTFASCNEFCTVKLK